MVGRHLEREVLVRQLVVGELLERHLLERSVVVGELLERPVVERRELVVRRVVLMIRRFVRSLQRQRFAGWVAQRERCYTRAWLARSWG